MFAKLAPSFFLKFFSNRADKFAGTIDFQASQTLKNMNYSLAELEILKQENRTLILALAKRDTAIQELSDQLAVKGYIKLSNEILKRHEISLPATVYSAVCCLV